ncbi:MAG TPA: hypothetical protein VFD27_01310 [Chthoniobacteraceae bacterium]|jgi:hypothetical protein|nr:hypothetical protein [Chthoniobacteraceae bacterium]
MKAIAVLVLFTLAAASTAMDRKRPLATYKAEDGSTAAWTENDLGQRVTVRSPERIKQIADHEASVAKYKQR